MIRTIFLAAASMLLANCATIGSNAPLAGFPTLTLAAVDGETVRQGGLILKFQNDGSYTATYDCDDHFGRYRLQRGNSLTFEPGASSGKTCDEFDLTTGKSVSAKFNSARSFFDDPRFSVSRSGQFVILKNRMHSFSFRSGTIS